MLIGRGRGARPHHSVAGLGAFLMVLMACVVGLGVLSLTSVKQEFDHFAEEDFPGFNNLVHIDRDMFRAQRALESSLLSDDIDRRQEAVLEYRSQVARTEARWNDYLEFAHEGAAEEELQRSFAHHRSNWLVATEKLAALSLEGRPPTDQDVLLSLGDAQKHFQPTRDAVHQLEEEFYEPLVERGTNNDQFDARILLLVLLAGGLLVGGIVSSATVRTTKRQYLDLQQRELNKRFRSLVEGAHDVVIVVSGIDDMTLMSSQLGALEQVSRSDSPSTIRELLGSAEYELWAEADRAVSGHLGSRSIELPTTRADGAVVYLEAHGSSMPDDPTERVWVWRDITAQKELELELSHQAFHDSLTGLANRLLLHDRVEHALALAARTKDPVTVLFCDLDDFKTINDSLGHSRGDHLLKMIANRIKTCVRPSDTVARLGGDEFAILLEGASPEMAHALAERILRITSFEVEVDDRKIFPSVSVGVATATPGITAEELLRNADLAMYAAKRSGKGHAEIYQAAMHENSTDMLDLHGDLKVALAEGQFSLHFQPTVDLLSETVEGVEALIRWNHPTRGLIPPDEFIHIAEATGLIIEIGRWVLQEACRAAVDLQKQQQKPLLMAVNLSPHQLRDPTIVDTVTGALHDAGLRPEQLVLEVTEGTLLDDALAVQRLHELRSLGVLIAVDDFGTGYTSISYLQSLPISIVKIDRSFISGDVLPPGERRAFLHAIVGLARSLNLRSVAEGIEDVAQLDELKALGCDTGQGYLWSPATPLPEAQSTIMQIENEAQRSTTAG